MNLDLAVADDKCVGAEFVVVVSGPRLPDEISVPPINVLANHLERHTRLRKFGKHAGEVFTDLLGSPQHTTRQEEHRLLSVVGNDTVQVGATEAPQVMLEHALGGQAIFGHEILPFRAYVLRVDS